MLGINLETGEIEYDYGKNTCNKNNNNNNNDDDSGLIAYVGRIDYHLSIRDKNGIEKWNVTYSELTSTDFGNSHETTPLRGFYNNDNDVDDGNNLNENNANNNNNNDNDNR